MDSYAEYFKVQPRRSQHIKDAKPIQKYLSRANSNDINNLICMALTEKSCMAEPNAWWFHTWSSWDPRGLPGFPNQGTREPGNQGLHAFISISLFLCSLNICISFNRAHFPSGFEEGILSKYSANKSHFTLNLRIFPLLGSWQPPPRLTFWCPIARNTIRVTKTLTVGKSFKIENKFQFIFENEPYLEAYNGLKSSSPAT
jgi:hypothetical protein